ncbi:hypothetical protein HYFRA_00003490 [Hymenoscyphus fraxineus]|uniref:Uncharacterized protein n=1 Tax=Hymenoscyphus fraxineus TaxID=746836 RepID=A0A9N9KUT5_9HELO|nr:hypothetical protein HYFRA_00003490 [Hymenoscyphus fraxineus]
MEQIYQPTDIPIINAPHNTILHPHYHGLNRFCIDSASEGIRWLTAIGTANASHITRVCISIPSRYNWLDLDKPLSGHQWCDFFAFLVKRAPKLREVTIFWDCDVHEWKKGFLGGGSDPDMCLALEELGRLHELVFAGFYDEDWPVFFGERVGVKVIEVKRELEMRRELSLAERMYLDNLRLFRKRS